jgi:hypothetical protein
MTLDGGSAAPLWFGSVFVFSVNSLETKPDPFLCSGFNGTVDLSDRREQEHLAPLVLDIDVLGKRLGIS